jgi:hypothetical protein
MSRGSRSLSQASLPILSQDTSALPDLRRCGSRNAPAYEAGPEDGRRKRVVRPGKAAACLPDLSKALEEAAALVENRGDYLKSVGACSDDMGQDCSGIPASFTRR